MKKNQVDAILADQVKRKKTILIYICVIFVFAVISFSCLFIFFNKNKTYYVGYKENSNLDYNVYLKENDFFEDDYLKSNNQYIASLIDYIKADFNYKLLVEKEDINYMYSYKIEANVNVKDKKTNNSLYNFNEVLSQTELTMSNSSSIVDINKSINIDYNHYNDLISKFVNVYDLSDVESMLTINMYVQVFGECDEIENADTDSVISLSIPLTTKTVAIDMKYDLVDETHKNLMACKNDSTNSILFIVVSILVAILDLILIFKLIKYIIDTRTAESIYEKELKKILNNYKSYIQKINNEFDLTGYQVLKVDTFTDMLEIRDTIGEPILMVESSSKNKCYFLIPSKTKIVYFYGLRVSDIRKKISKNKKS